VKPPRDNKNNALRHVMIDRVLLVGILIVQLGIIVWLLRQHQIQHRVNSTSPQTPNLNTLLSQDAQAHRPANRRGFPSPFPLPVQISTQRVALQVHSAVRRRHTMRRDVDRMMNDAFSLFDRMDSMMHFDDHWKRLHATPTMDMRETPDSYEVVISLPGITESDIEIKLEGQILTITGKVRTQEEGQRNYRKFETCIQLPGPVDAEQIAKTNIENGILRISIPKMKDYGQTISRRQQKVARTSLSNSIG